MKFSSPELFRYIENADPMKFKQLAKGIDQLADTSYALALAQEKFPDIKFHFTSEF